MGPEEERLQDELLRRAQKAVDAAAEVVAHSQVLASVSSALRDGTLTSRCAWCGRYRIAERWVVVGRGDMIERTHTTHGICEDCVAALRDAGLSV